MASLSLSLFATAVLATPAAPVISGPTSVTFIQHPRGFRGALSWDAVPTATAYRVYDAHTAAVLATVTAPPYMVYGIQGVVYRRYVVAVDGLGDASPPSNTLAVQTVAPAAPAAPSGYSVLPASAFDLVTSAPPAGTTIVKAEYDAAAFTGDPANLRLLHYTGGAWVDITTSVDTANALVIGETTSFSVFAVMEHTGPEPPTVITPASSLWSLALLVFGATAVAGVALTRRGRHSS
jgi:hypothetical protein